jgi:putative transposase
VDDVESHRKQMKRREVPYGARFITFSCEKRLPLLGRAQIRDVLVQHLGAARDRFGFELFAWVVMPEHVHLLARPREVPLGKALLALKLGVANTVLHRWRALDVPILARITRPNGGYRFWQRGGGFDRNVRGPDEFRRNVRYIHRNPVDRGLVGQPEDWRWSSARWWLHIGEPLLACDVPTGDGRDWSSWEHPT